MSMLNTNIVGGQAQTIVCTHSIDGDAHAVMQEFHAHYASKGNVTALCSDFHRELSLLQLTPPYPGGPTQFIQTFQSLYLDLEDATGKTINDEEKVGQLSASVIGHPTFSYFMSNLALIAKANNGTVKYCDAIDDFIQKSDEVSSNHRINPSNARSSSGNGNGPLVPINTQCLIYLHSPENFDLSHVLISPISLLPLEFFLSTTFDLTPDISGCFTFCCCFPLFLFTPESLNLL
jgi:hypothetical protein